MLDVTSKKPTLIGNMVTAMGDLVKNKSKPADSAFFREHPGCFSAELCEKLLANTVIESYTVELS